MPDRYFHIADQNEWIRYPEDAPIPAGVVVLPPENVFWQTLPLGEEITFDGGGLPNGTQPIPQSADDQILTDLQAAGISAASIVIAMYADHRGDASLLTALDSAIDTIATNNSTTVSGVLNVL